MQKQMVIFILTNTQKQFLYFTKQAVIGISQYLQVVMPLHVCGVVQAGEGEKESFKL